MSVSTCMMEDLGCDLDLKSFAQVAGRELEAVFGGDDLITEHAAVFEHFAQAGGVRIGREFAARWIFSPKRASNRARCGRFWRAVLRPGRSSGRVRLGRRRLRSDC